MDNPRRHVIVDGHNVLHAWGWMSAGEPLARARLIEALLGLSDFEPVEVTLMFDSRGAATAVDPVGKAVGFNVRYAAAGLTADGAIERLVAGDATPQRCVVVTGDTAVLGNVRAAGGEGISPDDLRAWIERCQARARRAMRVRRTADGEKFRNQLPL